MQHGIPSFNFLVLAVNNIPTSRSPRPRRCSESHGTFFSMIITYAHASHMLSGTPDQQHRERGMAVAKECSLRLNAH